MKTKKRQTDKSKEKVSSDEGHGQAGKFGSDGDWGKHKRISPDRSSPNVSEKDTRRGREG
ncbi:hypothetical protein [Chryseolinea soli]|uniref:Uncharacterized protein n=1 Tax=Chryseolinea soli TaxID=2321403 RepID=A0A385SLE4_9BACT|nr:hypothetical protein [Chryseolinea soli]AYB32583.1 hypothetical protein D4L85_19265 [Chryseolinea soli]